jgi:hypothetical protein
LIIEQNAFGNDIMAIKSMELSSFLSKKRSGIKEFKGLRKIDLNSPPSSKDKKDKSEKIKEETKVLAILKVEFEIVDVHSHSCMQAQMGQGQ